MGRLRPTAFLRALIVSNQLGDRGLLLGKLNAIQAVWATNFETAERAAAVQAFDVLWLDTATVDADARRRLLAFSPEAKVVLLGSGTPDLASTGGLSHATVMFLRRPFDEADVELAIRAVAVARRVTRDELSAAASAASLFDLPTQSQAYEHAIALARQVAATNTPLLIVGERGTGKAQLARAVHQWSDRADESFEIVHCGTSSAEELEDRWFGLANEAGCLQPPDVAGRLDACHGATLLLDEVTALPPALQLKIERLLTDGQYERRDDFTVRSVDVRVIATSSTDPQQAVRDGQLRPELLRALDVVRAELPPLRERPEDIAALAHHHLGDCERAGGGPSLAFAPDVLAFFQQYHWPGNQRELFNLIDRAVLLCTGDRVDLKQLSPTFAAAAVPAAPRLQSAYVPGDLVPLETIEDLHVRGVVGATGTIKQAAQVLGINYSTLWRRLRKQPGTAPLRLAPVKPNREAM